MKTTKIMNLDKLELSTVNVDLDSHEKVRRKIDEYNRLIKNISTKSHYRNKLFNNIMLTILSRKSSIGSNTIEGLFSTEEDLDYSLIEESNLDEISKNNAKIARRIKKEVHTGINWNISLSENALEIYNRIFKDIKKFKAGEFKKKNNFIIGLDKELIREFISFENTIEELDKLGDFIKRKKGKIFGLDLSAILHSYFIAIHPFSDGNGRIGRVILDKFLFDTFKAPIFLDEVFNLNKMEYISTLENFIDNNNVELLIKFYYRSIVDQLQRNIRIMKEIIDKENKIFELFNTISIKEKYHEELMYILLSFTLTTISKLSKHLKIDRRTAMKLIDELVKLKLLNKLEERGKSIIYKINRDI